MKNVEESAYTLKLAYLRKHGETFLEEATQRGLSPTEVLTEALDREVTHRKDAGQQRRIRQAKFQYKKYLTDFDYTIFQEEIRTQLQELSQFSFIQQKENAILMGNPGTGKTHFSIGLGMEACIEGYSVLFVNAPNLVLQLKEVVAESQFVRFKRRFEKVDLVIVDELGYISFDETGSELLFNLLSNRNDKGAILITTNLTFDRWQEIFQDPTLTGALIDRLAFQAHVVDMRGESYRIKKTASWIDQIGKPKE